MMIGAAERMPVQPSVSAWNPRVAEPAQAAAVTPAAEPLRFTNPGVRIDTSGMVIVEYRNASTGEVRLQVPSEEAVRRYKADQEQRHAEYREMLRAAPPKLPATEQAQQADPAAQAGATPSMAAQQATQGANSAEAPVAPVLSAPAEAKVSILA